MLDSHMIFKNLIENVKFLTVQFHNKVDTYFYDLILIFFFINWYLTFNQVKKMIKKN